MKTLNQLLEISESRRAVQNCNRIENMRHLPRGGGAFKVVRRFRFRSKSTPYAKLTNGQLIRVQE